MIKEELIIYWGKVVKLLVRGWLRSPHNGYGYEGYGVQHINPEGKFGGYDLSWGNNDDVGVSAAITISLR